MSGAGGNRRGRGRPPGGGKRGPQGDSSGSGGKRGRTETPTSGEDGGPGTSNTER